MQLKAKSIIINPSQFELKEMVNRMPNAQQTIYGNLAVRTRITSRSGKSTFFVSDAEMGQPTISRKDYEKIVSVQEKYLADRDMILIEGNIGTDSSSQVSSQLFIEKENANIAAMQQQLYFPISEHPKNKFTIIYTPNLKADNYPNGCVIAVDLENYVTRILGSDYFGESKKGGLRMWNKWVYDQGGLALHAGCKVYQMKSGKEKLALIIGLSGTGKTTTTFHQQLNSLPVQDDFCALFQGGLINSSENGCFAKTFGLDQKDEPTIYHALTQPESWLENVVVDNSGHIDFFNDSYTTNGRGTFDLQSIPHRRPDNLSKVDFILILNRNFNIIPAVVRLKPSQAAAYFMLGETTGTSAGGELEAGKFLRVPGTNPFFFERDSLQGNRFLDLIKTKSDIQVYLLNTGSIGGNDDDPYSKKVRINDSSTIMEGIVLNSIRWEEDPDFGYLIASEVPGITDNEILQPIRFYRRNNKMEIYKKLIREIKRERIAHLQRHPGIYKEIIQSII